LENLEEESGTEMPRIKQILSWMYEILTDVSDHPNKDILTKQQKKIKQKVEKAERKDVEKLTSAKHVIDDRIRKAQLKYPDMKKVAKEHADDIEQYINSIVDEVKLEYEQVDEENAFTLDNEKFIRIKLGKLLEKLKVDT